MTSRVRFPHRRRILLTLIAAATAITALPSPAAAATQIGETFTPEGDCDGTTAVQSGSPGGQYAAPFAGVITSWSYQAPASNVPQLKFKVARPAGGNSFTIVGQEGPHTPDANELETYPARIAVQAGDVIGLYGVTAGGCARVAEASYTIHTAFADPPPQTTFPFDGPHSGLQLDVSATLEPDCDSDGFGDETQDPDISSCNPSKADGTLTIDANKGKVEKGRKVTLSGQYDTPTNEACEPNRTIELQRRLKSQPDSAFATFETVQTDATGNFSTREKVRKTYFYRAVVGETETCDDETSNSQKVRVQKKKAAQEA